MAGGYARRGRETMNERPTQHDSIESLLRELDAAERTGVFRTTPVEVDRLVALPSDGQRSNRFRWAMRLLPVAAMLALAVGVWSVQHGGSSPYTSAPSISSDSHASANPSLTGHDFLGCFGAPGNGVAGTCQSHDYDADGDVDLADFSAYQLAYANTSRLP